jgi:hypothetical protein
MSHHEEKKGRDPLITQYFLVSRFCSITRGWIGRETLTMNCGFV